MNVSIHDKVADDYPDFLRDESRLAGEADSISFPENEEEIRESLAYAREKNLTITTQGGCTGLTGGAVSRGGHILNLSRMNRITGMRYDADSNLFFLAVQPGLLLETLREVLHTKDFETTEWSEDSLAALRRFKEAGPFIFPPDPTEETATLGGMVACNASGARSYYYGATRHHIVRLRLVLADGDVLDLQRGEYKADGRGFCLVTEGGGRTITGYLPSYKMPGVKTAAGYYAADGMDLIDLFVGSEGTLGVFAEIELKLVPAPAVLWGVMAFFPSEAAAIRYVRRVRGDEGESCAGLKPAAIEYFGHRALDLLRSEIKAQSGLENIPRISDSFHTAIYVEFSGHSEDAVSEAVMAMSEIMVNCGGDEDATWIATDPHEWQRLREFRHAVPECVNERIDERRRQEPGLTKLGTDMSVPDDCLERVIALYRDALDECGLEYVMFGHIAANHIHVNILPRTLDEYEHGKQLYLNWADEALKMGGSVSAEHGIGKIKVRFLEKMYGADGIREMKAVKTLFDGGGLLNAGNLFVKQESVE